MDIKDIIHKCSKDEVLLKKIRREIFQNKHELDSIERINIHIDISDNDVIDKSQVFLKFIQTKMLVQHLLNLFHNYSYFKDSSSNFVVNDFSELEDSQVVLSDEIPTEKTILHYLVQYTVLINILRNQQDVLSNDDKPITNFPREESESFTNNSDIKKNRPPKKDTSKRGLFCMYCDNRLTLDLSKCSVCEAPVEDKSEDFNEQVGPYIQSLPIQSSISDFEDLKSPRLNSETVKNRKRKSADGDWKCEYCDEVNNFDVANCGTCNGIRDKIKRNNPPVNVMVNRQTTVTDIVTSLDEIEKVQLKSFPINKISTSDISDSDMIVCNDEDAKEVPKEEMEISENTWVCDTCGFKNAEKNSINCLTCYTEKNKVDSVVDSIMHYTEESNGDFKIGRNVDDGTLIDEVSESFTIDNTSLPKIRNSNLKIKIDKSIHQEPMEIENRYRTPPKDTFGTIKEEKTGFRTILDPPHRALNTETSPPQSYINTLDKGLSLKSVDEKGSIRNSTHNYASNGDQHRSKSERYVDQSMVNARYKYAKYNTGSRKDLINTNDANRTVISSSLKRISPVISGETAMNIDSSLDEKAKDQLKSSSVNISLTKTSNIVKVHTSVCDDDLSKIIPKIGESSWFCNGCNFLNTEKNSINCSVCFTERKNVNSSRDIIMRDTKATTITNGDLYNGINVDDGTPIDEIMESFTTDESEKPKIKNLNTNTMFPISIYENQKETRNLQKKPPKQTDPGSNYDSLPRSHVIVSGKHLSRQSDDRKDSKDNLAFENGRSKPPKSENYREQRLIPPINDNAQSSNKNSIYVNETSVTNNRPKSKNIDEPPVVPSKRDSSPRNTDTKGERGERFQPKSINSKESNKNPNNVINVNTNHYGPKLDKKFEESPVGEKNEFVKRNYDDTSKLRNQSKYNTDQYDNNKEKKHHKEVWQKQPEKNIPKSDSDTSDLDSTRDMEPPIMGDSHKIERDKIRTQRNTNDAPENNHRRNDKNTSKPVSGSQTIRINHPVEGVVKRGYVPENDVSPERSQGGRLNQGLSLPRLQTQMSSGSTRTDYDNESSVTPIIPQEKKGANRYTEERSPEKCILSSSSSSDEKSKKKKWSCYKCKKKKVRICQCGEKGAKDKYGNLCKNCYNSGKLCECRKRNKSEKYNGLCKKCYKENINSK